VEAVAELDESTLPPDVRLVSDNPMVVLVTPGMMQKVNF
jgi:hypothetical protein